MRQHETERELHVRLLKAAIAKSGLSAQRYACEVLLRNPRTIRRWLAGEQPIPKAVVLHCHQALTPAPPDDFDEVEEG